MNYIFIIHLFCYKFTSQDNSNNACFPDFNNPKIIYPSLSYIMPENAWVELFIVESSSSHNFTYGWRLSNRIFANDLILLTKGEIIYSISTSSFIPSTKYYPCKKNIN